jgi:hypothetical protein
VAQQVELTNGVLAECDNREILKEKVTSMYNYPRYGCPQKLENKYFYSLNSGLQAQSVLYVQVWPPNLVFRVTFRLKYWWNGGRVHDDEFWFQTVLFLLRFSGVVGWGGRGAA